MRENNSSSRVLVLFAHPALRKSRVHKELIRGIDQIENVTFHDLYETYPSFDIDIEYEQQLLLDHDIIIFQHPFFWYSAPAIVKEWIDIVLEHGWAYGSEGKALTNKYWLHALSSGGPEMAYQTTGRMGHTVRELLTPSELSANLCNMKYVAPYVIYGAHRLEPEDILEERLKYHNFLQTIASTDNHLDEFMDKYTIQSNDCGKGAE